MTQQIINTGTAPNKGNGDPLRTAFTKINSNFTEVYAKLTALEDGSVVTDISGSVFADDSTLLVDGVNGKIVGDVATPSDWNITALNKTWNFGEDGNLTVPGDITSEGNINIEINLSDSTKRIWQFGEDGALTFPDGTSQSTAGGGAGSVSSLVNGAYTVSLGSTGTLTVPANGIITAPINQEFQLQAKDTNSLLRNEINLDPNNGTFMSVWGTEQNPSYSASSWATASWQNNGGQGYVLITNAEDLAEFWTAGAGSFVSGIEVSINGGARTSVTYYGDNEEQYDVELSVGAVPVSSPTTITSLTFYYRAKSIINIDYDAGEMLLNAQQMPIKLKTDNNINLESGGNLNIRGLSLTQPVRIYANNNTRIWEFGTDGSLTLPREGRIYGIGDGAAGDRYGYISWDGNSSGDGLGYNTMRLVPDLQGLEDLDQYIILDPTSPGHIHIRAGGTQDNSLADLYLGGENSHVKISAGLNPPVTVMANDNSWTFGTDGSLTIPGDIRSEGNINVDVNLSDSTLRRWSFGEDGALTFPNGTNYSGNDITVLSGGIPTGITDLNSNGGWNTSPYTNLATTGGTGSGLTVNAASNAGNGYLDTVAINTAGTGYTAGDVITITNENSLTATFTISTSHTWTLNTNGRTTFPNGVVPAHSYGAAGDKKGMLVFDDTYIYYCTADYVDNVTDIWKRTAHGAGTW